MGQDDAAKNGLTNAAHLKFKRFLAFWSKIDAGVKQLTLQVDEFNVEEDVVARPPELVVVRGEEVLLLAAAGRKQFDAAADKGQSLPGDVARR